MAEIEANEQLNDIDGEMEDDDDDAPDLFFRTVVLPDEPEVVSGQGMYFLRITNASFGVDVPKNSRTLLTVAQQTDDPDEADGIVCVLRQGQKETHQLDLLVTDAVQFSVSGKNAAPVHLVGYYSPGEQHLPDSGLLGQFPLGDDFESVDEDIEDSKADEALASMDNATKKHLLESLRKRKVGEISGGAFDSDEDAEPPAKKQKNNAGKAVATQKVPRQEGSKAEPQQGKKKKKKKKKKGKGQQSEQQGEPSPKQSQAQEPSPQHDSQSKSSPKNKRKWVQMKGGLKYKDLKVGTGKVANKNKKLTVYYVGQHDSGKVFDKSISGPGFSFTMGNNEVIDGWEQGMKGMKVGSKRRIVIPPHLAYGASGHGDIKGNETLTFTVELRNVQ